uniref:Uncharacterized protein n=1 Tax=Arundo donax TaxID=35708 RepID=A0A0A9AY07_ARUDO
MTTRRPSRTTWSPCCWAGSGAGDQTPAAAKVERTSPMATTFIMAAARRRIG